MKNYKVDNWVIIKFNGVEPHYRVLSGKSGGYLDGSSWCMESGIISVKSRTDHYVSLGEKIEIFLYEFFSTSGSCYTCNKESYGIKMNNAYVWDKLKKIYGDEVELMNEDTDWLDIDWLIKV